ncbi:hypothetical protein LCGC14_2103750 [marine sediment metagenome]|uniref:Uncharacterized protein n=1 Tax=marine sediment metagenome TaxID=412755 RepID=A0A0F9EWB4_9ZZZZ
MIIEQGIAKIIASDTYKYLDERKMQPILTQYLTKDNKTVVVPDFKMELTYTEDFYILCHVFIHLQGHRVRVKFHIQGELISWWELHQALLKEFNQL